MLIVKEFAQFPDSMTDQVSMPLEAEARKYGYAVHHMFFGEKKYVFAFRDFHLTPSKPLPEVPDIQTYNSTNSDADKLNSMNCSAKEEAILQQ